MAGTIERPRDLPAVWILPCLLLAACNRGGVSHPRQEAAVTTPANETSGFMRVYRDPQTGAFTTPPPGAVVASPATRVAPSSALTEVPGPRGGFVVDLQGRFDSYMSATVGKDGHVETSCVDARGRSP